MNQTEKRLRKSYFSGCIDEGWIIIKSTRKVIVDAKDKDGDTHYDKSESLAQEVIECLSTDKHAWGGFRTAGGFWYLEKDYDHRPMQSALRDQLGPAYYD